MVKGVGCQQLGTSQHAHLSHCSFSLFFAGVPSVRLNCTGVYSRNKRNCLDRTLQIPIKETEKR